MIICVYRRSEGDAVFEKQSVWEDGEWVTGEDAVSGLRGDESPRQILSHYDGPGNVFAAQFESRAAAPAEVSPQELSTSSPTVELDDTNWFRHEQEEDLSEADLKTVYDMSDEEIREEIDDPEKAELFIRERNEAANE